MNKTNISISSYGNYSSGNYGVNCICIDVGNLTLYFSYKTVIAFNDNGDFQIIKNYWNTTTGKHLNWIDDNKSIRLDSETFDKKLNRVLKKHKLNV